ncbi:aromatic amino acid transaminase [Lichenihabitans psoromatis]|uniref:amino acid aminotransferase n=1 Tax=Lichenihabitans psoromatis TaxID=2528642 RepID=UPI001036B4B3|nr:amino acid aminotransferase [Lichenihabitans psoromatis]
MFNHLEMASPDKILSLMGLFRDDPRPEKIDLGIGVYRDLSGHTPILACVREAEQRLLAQQDTKTYVSPVGDERFTQALTSLVFGDHEKLERMSGLQTPGGAGALRLLAGLLAQARPGGRIWVPDPTWTHHHAVFADAGLDVRVYPYLNGVTHAVDVEAMLDTLLRVQPGDVVLLHGCCHNPSGADPTPEQWRAIVDVIVQRGLFPFVDLAYQGFGEGLEQDAAATRLIARHVPEMVIAYSCSKNFGIYRERTGGAFVLGETASKAAAAKSQLAVLARLAYSMPPDHGASVVRIILEDEPLSIAWRVELATMRDKIQKARLTLADAFRKRTGGDRYGFLARHKGMFSLLGTTADDAVRLREDHAVYVVGDGRINLAGLQLGSVDRFVGAVLSQTRQ